MAEAKSQPEPGAGDITIMLAGKEQTMHPSLEACMAISKLAGGAHNVINRLLSLDFEMICEVIALGTGFTSLNERKIIQQSVYDTGTINLFGDCVLFVRIINNGGRLPDDSEGGDEDEPDAPLSQPESSITA